MRMATWPPGRTPKSAKRVRQPVHALVEPGVGPSPGAARHGQILRKRACRFRQQCADVHGLTGLLAASVSGHRRASRPDSRQRAVCTQASLGSKRFGQRRVWKFYAAGIILMQTGCGVRTSCPVGVSLPVRASIRYVKILSVFWLAANRNCPEGSTAKLRGNSPRVDS